LEETATEAYGASVETLTGEASPEELAAAHWPSLISVSGLYRSLQRPVPLPGRLPLPRPIPLRPGLTAEYAEEDETAETAYEAAELEPFAEAEPEQALSFPIYREELRLDVDGRYPQMTASGTLYARFGRRVHWIARLRQVGRSQWVGRIWYKDGATATFPYTAVRISAKRSFFPHQRAAKALFFGGGGTPYSRAFRFASSYYHPVEFEYDHETGVNPDLEINTCAHPNRPASMQCERLSIERVYRRAGFNARRDPRVSDIPTDGPDPNATWSDAEMHDAMQIYWSHFADKPQWSMWVLFAKLHDMGHGLGGIMFDDIGPNHRQGTAIFNDSFISDAPAGDPAPSAWAARMRFWTAVHEMGHAFNLAHSWQKHLGAPWIPLSAEPEARSFMNYPYRVTGGQTAFFADFDYRFSNNELLFMRHAPERFVQMGNADWFDDHGFEQEKADTAKPDFKLEITVDRRVAAFEFLEPIVPELKITNISNEPKLVPADVLTNTERMVVIIKKDGKPARRWAPFARYCQQVATEVLQPKRHKVESLFVSAGLNGWDLAEPGHYTVQVALELAGRILVSDELRLRVQPPKGYEEELIAQDVFTEEPGRVMAFDGSAVLRKANDTWRELIERAPKSRAARHARVALAMPLTRNYRRLRIDAPAETMCINGKAAFAVNKADPAGGRTELSAALTDNPAAAAETLGGADYEYYCGTFADWLRKNDDEKEAQKVEAGVKDALAKLGRLLPEAPAVAAAE